MHGIMLLSTSLSIHRTIAMPKYWHGNGGGHAMRSLGTTVAKPSLGSVIEHGYQVYN